MERYLNVFYNEALKPVTEYPLLLSRYLVERYGIDRNATMLDVGCGRGDVLNAFAKLGLKVNGLDLQPYGSLAPAGIRHADFEHDPFPYEAESFDLVFSKSVIEHLHKPENFLRECKRVLRRGGRVIIMTPDWQTHRYIFYNDHTHVQPYIVNGLANALRLHGFDEVAAELFVQLPSFWKFPFLYRLTKPLRLFFPVKCVKPSSWWRWSRELMILATAVK